MGDVFLDGVFDLFGDPVPASRGRKGRPAHVPTTENRRFVQLALACGHDEPMIAAALRITERTLTRHYFHELEGRRTARLRLDMKNLGAIVAEVEKGNVSAMAQLDRRLAREAMKASSDRLARPAAQSVSTPIGKKEAARAAAQGVTGKYAPRPAPSLN